MKKKPSRQPPHRATPVTDRQETMVEALRRAAAAARLQALGAPKKERHEQLARILHALVRAEEDDESLKSADAWAKKVLDKHSKATWILETTRNPFPTRSVAVERLTEEAEFLLSGNEDTKEILEMLVIRATSFLPRLLGAKRAAPQLKRSEFLPRDPEILVREALRQAGLPVKQVRSVFNFLNQRVKRRSNTET